jgi:hypothetical protein
MLNLSFTKRRRFTSLVHVHHLFYGIPPGMAFWLAFGDCATIPRSVTLWTLVSRSIWEDLQEPSKSGKPIVRQATMVYHGIPVYNGARAQVPLLTCSTVFDFQWFYLALQLYSTNLVIGMILQEQKHHPQQRQQPPQQYRATITQSRNSRAKRK